MFSTKNSSPQKKPPFYYIAHPHEAYVTGYNAYLGNGHDSNIVFQAYNYYLPMEAVRWVPKLNDYFHHLISSKTLEPGKKRRRSFLESIDTAIAILHRTDYINERGGTIAIGSKYIKPVTWAFVGLERSGNMWQHHFYNIYSLIKHYTTRYAEPCHCYPICLYHAFNGREMLDRICKRSSDGAPLSANVVLAAAIHFLADLLQHCGPDATDYFDLFTNDLSCSPETVDIDLWMKAREKALFGATTNEVPKKQIGFHTPYVQGPPPPKPMRIRVQITEEGVDDLAAGLKATPFQSIIVGAEDMERIYRNEYY